MRPKAPRYRGADTLSLPSAPPPATPRRMSEAAPPTAAAPSDARRRRLGLASAISAISVAGLGFGHSIPLFSVLLDRAGASGFANGSASAAGALAVILATPFYPRVIARLGLKRFLLLSVLVMVLGYAAIYAVRDHVWAWYPLRFVFSAGASGMFVGSEVWINGVADKATRGRLIGLYSTCLALGFAMGPLLLDVTGYDGAAPFLVGGAVFAAAALPLLGARPPVLPMADEDARVVPVVRSAPVTFGASSLFGAVEGAVLVFLPLLVLASGYGESASAQVVAAYGFGLVAFQYLIGQAADRLGIVRVLIACSVLAAVLAGLLPTAEARLASLFACVFVLGGMIGGVSTTGLVLLGDRFEGRKLAAASTGYAFAWGLGAIVGPSAAGAIKDRAGFDAVFFAMVVLLGAYALAAFWRRGAAFP